MLETEFFESVIYNRNSYVYMLYMVFSWDCEVTVILTQKIGFLSASLCEDVSDLTSPTSNQYI